MLVILQYCQRRAIVYVHSMPTCDQGYRVYVSFVSFYNKGTHCKALDIHNFLQAIGIQSTTCKSFLHSNVWNYVIGNYSQKVELLNMTFL